MKIDKRNDEGVKDSYYMYRTRNGITYNCWIDGYNDETTITEYKRLKGLKIDCFRIKNTIFVNENQIKNLESVL